MASFEAEFKEKLYEKYSRSQKYLIPKEEYCKILEDLKTATEVSSTKSRHHYYILQKLEVLVCDDVEKLIKQRKMTDEQPLYYVTIEDMHDIISWGHIATGHGGRDRMLKHLNQKYANITTEAVELCKSYCLVCQEKRKRPRTTGVVVKRILSRELTLMDKSIL